MARQMALAEQLDLPVVIHDRDAHGDCMDMVRAFPGVRGEFHCYSGSVEDARILLDRGWYLGFGGALTFKNARKAPEVAAYAPLDRLLLETDSPYLAPVPFRGKRNDSRYLPYVAERIAAIKGICAEEAERITWENALRFLPWKGHGKGLQRPHGKMENRRSRFDGNNKVHTKLGSERIGGCRGADGAEGGRSPQKKGYLCCLLAGAAWGVAGVCGQFLFDQRGWSVDFIIPLRILLAGC